MEDQFRAPLARSRLATVWFLSYPAFELHNLNRRIMNLARSDAHTHIHIYIYVYTYIYIWYPPPQLSTFSGGG